jgi:ATP-binding cassette subfamily G (WHITE) protein 5 (sterolin 1)
LYVSLCRYLNGTHYLVERYSYPGIKLDQVLEPWTNIAINFAFPAALALANLVFYLIPLPAFVKAKFRE